MNYIILICSKILYFVILYSRYFIIELSVQIFVEFKKNT